MKTHILFITAITLSHCITAQPEQKEQKEINQQVWLPFIQAFNNYNTEAFMAVHHKNLARVTRDAKQIYTFTQYKKQYKEEDQRSKNLNIKRTIELRFLERIASPTQAFEVGIYKTTITQPKVEPHTIYGKFTVLLCKEKDTWKIVMDSDTAEKNTISASDFITASAIE